MDVLNYLKKKTDALKDGAGKKKAELLEKAAEIKNEYDDNQRKKLEDWVYKKEIELKTLESTLKEREKKVLDRERRMDAKGFVRFIGVTAGLSLFGVFVLFFQFVESLPPGGASGFTPASELVSKKPLPADPYTPRERALYSTFNDINADDPNYDVSGYCERKVSANAGSITYEECMTVAAAKILKGQN